MPSKTDSLEKEFLTDMNDESINDDYTPSKFERELTGVGEDSKKAAKDSANTPFDDLDEERLELTEDVQESLDDGFTSAGKGFGDDAEKDFDFGDLGKDEGKDLSLDDLKYEDGDASVFDSVAEDEGKDQSLLDAVSDYKEGNKGKHDDDDPFGLSKSMERKSTKKEPTYKGKAGRGKMKI